MKAAIATSHRTTRTTRPSLPYCCSRSKRRDHASESGDQRGDPRGEKQEGNTDEREGEGRLGSVRGKRKCESELGGR
ncbi:hypothetical protein Pcinc_017093 [Petrolisthes cinctipes]|uniref:Uncharacterized protein n=1 Tax=Petrolisthes cinctipes TaxID=88211 RepID=A0AAE1KNW1_PETCI|nr:hypothetical protein Pcinc_017093 [Petrolisthes cinctipes]